MTIPATGAGKKFVLEDEGFPVETTCSGEEALRAVGDKHPSLVSPDVGLPGIDLGLVPDQAMDREPK